MDRETLYTFAIIIGIIGVLFYGMLFLVSSYYDFHAGEADPLASELPAQKIEPVRPIQFIVNQTTFLLLIVASFLYLASGIFFLLKKTEKIALAIWAAILDILGRLFYVFYFIGFNRFLALQSGGNKNTPTDIGGIVIYYFYMVVPCVLVAIYDVYVLLKLRKRGKAII